MADLVHDDDAEDKLTPSMISKLTVSQWAKHFADQDRRLIDNAIRSGLIAGFDNMEIARKVIGSLQLNGIDGATEITRRQIGMLSKAATASRKKVSGAVRAR